ncbi:MAG: hypothetical protein ACE5O2_09040 [Armatimonadota bacterium]
MRMCIYPVLIGVVALVVAGLAPAVAAEHRSFEEITPEASALKQAEARQKFDAYRQWAADVGLTPRDVFTIMRAKGEMHRLQERLLAEAAALSVVLQTREADDEQVAEAVKRYVDLKNWTVGEMKKIQDDLIARLDAENNPRAMGALLIMGAVDNGTRLLCAIHNGVAGGTPTNVISPESEKRVKVLPGT